MRQLGILIPPGDRRLVLVFAALLLFSLAILWSVTEGIHGPYESFPSDVGKSVFWRQLFWVAVGWAAMVAAARLPLRPLEGLSLPLYLGAVALLVLVLLVGPSVAGTRRWLVLGPLRAQPSELAKVCALLVMAAALARWRPERRQAGPMALTLLLALVPALLVLREPDLGTSLVFPAIWLGLVIWYGISPVILLGLATIGLSAVVSFYGESIVQEAWPYGIYMVLLLTVLFVGRFRFVESGIILAGNLATGLGIPWIWEQLKPYQQERILTFFIPGRNPHGFGYQAIQSRVAIGSGGLFGTGYLQGTQKGLAFLPERHTDFIFSVVGEELGFAGAAVLLVLFLVLIMRAIELADAAQRPFPRYLAAGVATYFAFHVVVNVGITTGLLPVTGLPLPLLSYGGSNLVASSFLVGLLLNVSARQYV